MDIFKSFLIILICNECQKPIIEQHFSNLYVPANLGKMRILSKYRFSHSVDLDDRLRFCPSNMCPRDTDAAGLRTRPFVPQDPGLLPV